MTNQSYIVLKFHVAAQTLDVRALRPIAHQQKMNGPQPWGLAHFEERTNQIRMTFFAGETAHAQQNSRVRCKLKLVTQGDFKSSGNRRKRPNWHAAR